MKSSNTALEGPEKQPDFIRAAIKIPKTLRTPVRREEAPQYLLVTLLAFAASVTLIRAGPYSRAWPGMTSP